MTDSDPHLPQPANGSRWRWANPRRALLGGGVLAAALSLGSVAAGATTSHSTPPSSNSRGAPPTGQPGTMPTAGGKITALSGDNITIVDRNKATQTIVYSSSTTFRTMSGSTTSGALKVGDFITVVGSKASDGTVTATSIMVGNGQPPGKGGPPPGHKGAKPPTGKGAPPSGSAPNA